jgi:ABC-type ATPase with predicted acetyltransferase domain
VAKIMSHSLQKFARKFKKKIIVCSCHYDIEEWLNPDWVLDCNKQHFEKHEAKKKYRKEKLKFEIKEVGRETWRYFSKYHYLSSNLPGGKLHLFGLFINGNQVGFQCFANYVPYKNKTKKKIFHSNRTVIHPDYQGFGLGLSLINETSIIMARKYDYRIMAKFSSLPIYKQMIKNKDWVFIGAKRLMGKMKTGGNMARNKGIRGGKFGVGGYREGGVKTFNFEFNVKKYKNT